MYLTDPKNFCEEEKKAKIKTNFFGYVSRWQDYPLSIWDGIFFAPADAVERTLVGLAEKIVAAFDQARNLKNALTDLPMLKTIFDNGKFSKSRMSRLSLYIQLIVTTFKTSNLIILLERKLQFIIMPLYEPKKLLDSLKAVSKKTHIKIDKFSNSIYVIIIF